MSAFQCYYCQSNAGAKRFDTEDFYGDHFSIIQCQSCDTFNLSPRPTAAQLERAYNRDYYGAGDSKFNPAIEKMLLASKKRRAKLIAKHVGSGKVLDIGCADGSALSQFYALGNFECEGIEIDAESALRASKNEHVKLHIGQLKDLDLAENSYSVITLNHVFEHLPDPKFVLEKSASLLKSNGVLMIAIPNIESYQAKWFKSNWFHLDPPRHLFFMSRNKLISELGKLGFELKHERHDHFEYNPYGFQQSILNALQNQRESLYEWLKGNKHEVHASAFNIFIQRLFVYFTLPLFWLVSKIAAVLKKSGTMEFYFVKKSN
ncbi:MAG: class I SAM-dependent methyltransferase [Salibacteraceae bacterium]|jgi:SAM-dependent methyltransferase|nr:class I SAM-dependent methyltransferase [Salibacteraceae bacterium]MDP4686068.1 class I SAM-dependent methyltransferase [Salibacteraceae bacterium]MDP4764610.1 class I SAM-dependent methyltransferase [Salibacteraceae bacterium]MDP4844389.1 class I SAM-dependent methyltransferase [Salibacteraceae bacterium]MDP4934603.1 class I SAM-dependent methyltransferase [Salibacteraceae bacterium]